MKYDLIFWDNDGILVDTERYYLQANRQALAQIGIDLTEGQFAEVSLAQGRSVFDLARGVNIPDASIQELKRWRDARYAKLLATKDLTLAGAEETLMKLHGKVNMAIVTSSQKHHFHIIHRRTGFLKYIDFYLTREDYGQSKPAAEPYQLALQRSGFTAEKIVVIEDSPRGLKSAKAAGLTCWVLPGAQTIAEDFSAADRVLDSILDVPKLVL